MTRAPNPCHGCGKRTAECHARCPEYAAYQASREAEREARRRRREESIDADIMLLDRMDRERRRKRL